MRGTRCSQVALATLLIFFLTSLLLCTPQTEGKDPRLIAQDVCDEVGVMGKVSKGRRGAPILILEEDHSSRVGQIQHAIMLVRLYERHGLRHIGLEGYLKEDPKINTEWFISAAKELSSTARNRIAVTFLKEGEISCAEFMKLLFEDVSLHSIEKMSEYPEELSEEASYAVYYYLIRIAQQSLREEHLPKLQQFENELEDLQENGDEEALIRKTKELFDYILSTAPWVQAKVKIYEDKEAIRSMSAEQYLSLVTEIESRAKKLSVEFEPNEIKAMQDYKAFYQARIDASETMVHSTAEIADKQDVSVVAMNVGAAHTKGMCEMLSAKGRPYAVLTPLALEEGEEIGDLSWDALTRKYNGLSVYSEGFMKFFLSAFEPTMRKKYKPVLPEEWFQAKAELYLFVERITQHILGPPEPPAGGIAPFSFGDDAFKGKRIFVDPSQITIIPDPPGQGSALLFPVVLNWNSPERSSVLWAKVGLTNEILPSQDRETVESLLMEALEDVRSGEEFNNRVEDRAGCFQPSLNTVVAIGRNSETARNTYVGSIRIYR